jgi:hypothetical protein
MKVERGSWLARVMGVGTASMVWRTVRANQQMPAVGWFGGRFLTAATVVVEKWGPAWARKRVLGWAPIGAWILLALWLGLPLVLASKLW